MFIKCNKNVIGAFSSQKKVAPNKVSLQRYATSPLYLSRLDNQYHEIELNTFVLNRYSESARFPSCALEVVTRYIYLL